MGFAGESPFVRTRTVQTLPHGDPESLPEWAEIDVRSPPTLPEWAIEEFSDPGDSVLDPFAGFGTTLRAARRLEREAYGIELEERRVEYVRDRLATDRDRGSSGRTGGREQDAATGVDEGFHVAVGDATAGDAAFRDSGVVPPSADLLYTAPPYMLEGTDTDPLDNYRGDGTYEEYLEAMTEAFEAVNDLLAADATVVVEASNLRAGPAVTTLAWDLAEAIDRADGYRFRTEIVVGFEEEEGEAVVEEGRYGYGYDHCYCLVFDRKGT